MSARKRYVIAGTGVRSLWMFGKPLTEGRTRYCELAGLFDHNPIRMRAFAGQLGVDVPMHTDFSTMLREACPDAVVIATRDSTHGEFIVQTLAAGLRAISEKPVCVDGSQCRTILAAAREYSRRGGQCLVTHNLRYAPEFQEMKRLIRKGAIGNVKVVNFAETLDRRHGADYFRRWHRLKKNSGGLLIHKASHHFDVINWLVESRPDELVARGGLMVYGRNGKFRGTRCTGCRHAGKCEFHSGMWDSAMMRGLYREAEAADGYIRDACVFAKEIDIEDSASVLYRYENGVEASYSLTAFASTEGMRVEIEGTKGRLELTELADTSWLSGSGRATPGLGKLAGRKLMLITPKQGFQDVSIPEVEGGHGGADYGLQRDFFGRPFDAPLTESQAPLEQAIQAVLVGHAANISIARGSRPVKVQDFLRAG